MRGPASDKGVNSTQYVQQLISIKSTNMNNMNANVWVIYIRIYSFRSPEYDLLGKEVENVILDIRGSVINHAPA